MHWKERGGPEGQNNDKALTPPEDVNAGIRASTEHDSAIDASCGAFSNGLHGPSYVGPTNWEAVLDTILISFLIRLLGY